MSELKHITILTGAGISAESGIPVFRSETGLWEQHRVEDVATYEGFARNPELVHAFYNKMRSGLSAVEPNVAHNALVKLAAKWPQVSAGGSCMNALFIEMKPESFMQGVKLCLQFICMAYC